MNKNTIEIRIINSNGQQLHLELSSGEYKHQFREFVLKHKLTHQEAFQLKTTIQMKLVQTSRVGLRQNDGAKTIAHLELSNKIEIEKEKPDSCQQKGKNKTITTYEKKCDESESSTDIFNGLNKNVESLQKLPTFCIEKQKSHSQKEKQSYQQSIQDKLFTQQFHHTSTKKINYVHPKMQIQTPQYQRRNRSPSQEVFGRLYHNRTASFNNKKNEQVHRSQELDYLQVQKYQLNNSLKRTTNDFFNDLSHNHTVSFSKKTAKINKQQEQCEDKQSCHLTPVRSRKGSPYFGVSQKQSGSRCEMREQIKKRQKQLSLAKAKEVKIRQRMKEQSTGKDSNKKSNSQSPSHKTCQKCHPKLEVKSQKHKHKLVSCKKPSSRPYVSNLLQQCYNQFVSDLQKL